MHINEFKRFFCTVIKVADGVLPFVFWLLIIFAFADPCSGFMTVLAAAIHEGGHITVREMSGKGIGIPRAVLGGFRLKRSETMSYRGELLFASAGPAANILTAVLCFFINRSGDGYLELFAMINMMTALSNLLPVEGYDGYRAAYCSCCIIKGGEAFLPVLQFISSLLVVSLTFLSLYLMLRFGEGYWIFAVFAFNLISLAHKKLKNSIF